MSTVEKTARTEPVAGEPVPDHATDTTVELPMVRAGRAKDRPVEPDAAPTVELAVVPALAKPAAPGPPGWRKAEPAVEQVPSAKTSGPAPAADAPVDDADRAEQWRWGLAFGLIALAVVLAHVGTALLLAVSRVATEGEARLTVAALAARGTDVVVAGALPLWDRFGALQIAMVELLLPDADPVDAARWACLAFGAVTTLLMWPVLRNGLKLSVTATTIAVAVLGLALPLLSLRAGITAAAPAAFWLTVAALMVVGERLRLALVPALIAVASAPLAAAALLGCAAQLIFTRSLRAPAPRVTGVVVGLAAVAVAVLASGAGPLAGTGPDVPLVFGVTGAAVGVVLMIFADHWARWLRPVLAGAVLLVLAAAVPGPSGAAAALIVAPILAAAVAAVAEQVRSSRALRTVAAVAVVAVLAIPLVYAGVTAQRPAPGASLAAWVASQTGPSSVIAADPLDRAALLAAGVPAGRLRDVADAPVPGELRLVSVRPDGTASPCPSALVLAATPRGTGGAPGAVCRTDAAGPDDRTARARFGSALATNPALTLAPDAAAVLRAGDTDPRLLLTLAALTGAHQVVIADLPVVPLDAAGTPRHQARVSLFDGRPAAESDLLRNWLGAQQPPFVPAVTSTGPDLLIAYPEPAPAGLLPS